MVTVPTPEDRVRLQPIAPGPPPARVPEGLTGDTRAIRQAQKNLEEIGRQFEEQKGRADRASVLQIDTDFHDERIREMNEQKGLLGESAINSNAETIKRFEKFGQERMVDLPESQREAAARSFAKHRNALTGVTATHEQQQTDAFYQTEFARSKQSLLKSSIENSGNIAAIGENIAFFTGVAADFAADHNRSEQWLKGQIDDFTSLTHMGVIKSLNNKEQDLAAKEYFNTIKDLLQPQDLLRAEAMTQEGSTRAAAQAETDAIMASLDFPDALGPAVVPVDMRTALQMARDIKDPKVRTEVERMVKTRFQELRAIEALNNDADYEKWAPTMDQSPPGKTAKDLVPAGDFALMDQKVKDDLNRRIPPPKMNGDLWVKWQLLEDKEVLALSETQVFREFLGHFTPPYRDRALKRVQVLRGKKPEEFQSEKSATNFLFRKLQEAQISGITNEDTISTIRKKEDKIDTYMLFDKWMNERFQSFFNAQSPKRNPNDEEKRKIIEDLVLEKGEKLMVRRTDWIPLFGDVDWLDGDEEKAIFEIIRDKEEDPIYVPFESIPAKEVKEMENYINGTFKGAPITNDKLSRMWAARRMNNRPLFIQIAAEK